MPFWYENIFWVKFVEDWTYPLWSLWVNVSIPKCTLKFVVSYGNKINAGQYACGRLTPPYLAPYFKTLPADSWNYIMNTGLAFD